MADNVGKKFEEKVRGSLELGFPNYTIMRLMDQQSRYKGQSSNPCDFVAYLDSGLFLIECKTTKDPYLHIKSKIKQYDDLLKFKGKVKTHPGVLVWYYNYDLVYWIEIEEIERMVLEGKKSIHKDDLLKGTYKAIAIPFSKPRVYPVCDFSILNELK